MRLGGGVHSEVVHTLSPQAVAAVSPHFRFAEDARMGMEPLPATGAMNDCSFVRRDCEATLVRTSRINSSDQVVDTVVFAREAAASSAAPGPSRSWPVRGSGVIVCYSGLKRTFGEETDRVLTNHVELVLRPLADLFPGRVYVAFSVGERPPTPSALLPRVHQILSDEARIAPSRVIVEQRDDGRQVPPVSPRGGNDSVTQCAPRTGQTAHLQAHAV